MDSLYHAIPQQFGVLGNRIVISEIENHAIKIFYRKKLETIIYSSHKSSHKSSHRPNVYSKYDENSLDFDIDIESIPNKKLIFQENSYLQVPGKIVVGEKDTFFVVNRLETPDFYQKKISNIQINTNQNLYASTNSSYAGYSNRSINISKKVKQKRISNNKYSHYNILELNTKGELIRSIERKRKKPSAFQNIIWIETDVSGKLWVLYLYNKKLMLDAYIKGKLFFYIEEEKCLSTLFPIQDKKSIYTCLRMHPFYNEKEVLLVGKVEKKPNKKNNLKPWNKEAFERYTIKILNWDFNTERVAMANIKDRHSIPYLPYGKESFLVLNPKKNLSYQMFNTDGFFLQTINLDVKKDFPFPILYLLFFRARCLGFLFRMNFYIFKNGTNH